MLTCHLMGGLGNQLFQIAATISLAINNNDKYIFAGTTNGDVFRTKLSDFGITDVPYTKITNFEYQIIPNPASDFIEITGVGAQNVGAHCNVPLQDIQNNIQIYNILGEMVLFNPQPLTPEPLKINISALSAGVYYLKIGNVVKMFIKE